MDDLTFLEIVNLLTIGISFFNIKQSIPSDIIESNQYIPPENLKSQGISRTDRYLDKKSENEDQ